MFKNLNSKDFFQSKAFKIIFIGIAAVIVLLLVFFLGELVGFKKADFSYKWGDNYSRNFAGTRFSFGSGIAGIMDARGQNFMPGHGTFGTVIKVENSSSTPDIVVQDQNNSERVILITKDTIIEKFRDIINIYDIKVNDHVVIIGSPDNSGQVEARLIRIMPSGSSFVPMMQQQVNPQS